MTLKSGLEDRVRGLALENAHIIMVKEPHLAHYLASMKLPDLGRKIGVLVVESFENVATLDEKMLNSYGWFKK
jgi:hypothetical protein